MLLNYKLFNNDHIFEYKSPKFTEIDFLILVEEIKKIRQIIDRENISSIQKLMRKSQISRNKINALIETGILSKDDNKNFILNSKREIPPKEEIKKALKKFKEINKEKEEMKQNRRKEDISNLLNQIYKKIKKKGFKYLEKDQLLSLIQSDDFKEKFDYKIIKYLIDFTPLEEEIINVSDKSGDISSMKQIIAYRWKRNDPEPNEDMINKLYKKAYYDKEDELEKMKRQEEEKTLAAKIAKTNREMREAGKRLK